MVRSPYYQEQLTEGLLYQKYQPHIHCLTFTKMTKETVDAAYNLLTGLNKEYAENKQHLQLMYSLDDVQSTPYLLKRIKESLKTVQDTMVHSSAIIADSFLMKVLEALAAPIINKLVAQSIKFCETETEAFQWFDERRKTLGE